MVWGTYLRALPFPGADRLVRVALEGETADAGVESVPWEVYRELGDVPGVESHGAWLPLAFHVAGLGGPARYVQGAQVTASLLPLSGLRPVRGRLFTAEEVARGERVAVVAEDASTGLDLGDTFRLYGDVYTVVGVMPAGLRFPFTQDHWVPMDPSTAVHSPWLQVLARAEGPPSPERLAALEDVLDARLAALSPAGEAGPETGPPRSAVDAFASAYHDEELRTGHWASLAGAVLLLVLACANAANLFLARGLRRRREMAVRLSLGARRRDLVRQLLTETTLLALLGGALAWLLTRGGLHLYRSDLPNVGPAWVRVDLGPAVALGIVGLCLAAALLAGLAPAWRASKVDPRTDLTAGSHGGRSHTESLLVVLQVAVSVALLAATGLLLRTLDGLETRYATLAEPELATASYSFYGVADDPPAAWGRILAEIESMPEVASAAAVYQLPVDPEAGWTDRVAVEGREGELEVQIQSVSAGTFETLERPPLRGRELRPADAREEAGPRAVLVDARLAERLSALGVEPLGARLRLPRAYGPGESGGEVGRVVGIVPALGSGERWKPRVYLSLEGAGWSSASLLLRLHASAVPGLAQRLAEAAHRAVPDSLLHRVRSLETVVDERLATRATAGRAFLVLGGVALALASVGLYGVLAVGVGRRRREIGIRAALGAEPAEIVALVVRSGLFLVATGAAAGVLLAVWLGRSLEALLHGVEPWDPASLAGAVGVLLLVALGASWIPARRAARVDPSSVLREP